MTARRSMAPLEQIRSGKGRFPGSGFSCWSVARRAVMTWARAGALGRGSSLWLTLLLCLAGPALPALAQDPGHALPDGSGHPLLTASPLPPQQIRIDGPEVVRRRFVTLDPQQMVRRKVLELNLFPDVTILVDRQRSETILGSGRIWIGRTRDAEGTVTLAAVDDVLVGNIRIGGDMYEIRYAGAGIHVTYEIDTEPFEERECLVDDSASPTPLESFADSGKTSGAADSAGAGIDNDPCDLIDLLVLFTPTTESSAGGTPAMEALVYLAVAETNHSFEISGVTSRLNLVHMASVKYTETGKLSTDRDRLKNPSDGYMDVAHTLRDRYCADITSLIVNTGNGCGIAYVHDPAPRATFESSAFNVTVRSCATGYFSFGHELGHLMGARHDWYVDDSHTPYTHSHGFVNVADKWRTIMAYNSRCKASKVNCTRLGRWSNAGIAVGGDDTGVATGTSTSCTANNANNPDCDAENFRSLNATACTVANFRDRSTCSERNDLWMKDTWTDTGAEPDPLTAGQSMWKSRTIWVRNRADPQRLSQHQHQNPSQGETNYVYVKLHNDFSSNASGQLKLYYAVAATGLSWPSNWTLFSDKTVTVSANDTDVVEATWVPPAAGHYCLLARWDAPTSPSDPMTHAEGTNVSVNTRNNNNIIWRNINVKKMSSGQGADVAPVVVRNVEQTPRTIDLLVRLGDTPQNFIRRGGEVTLDLGLLYDRWQEGGALGTGIADLGGTRLQILDTPTATSEILGLAMDPQEESEVYFSLTAPNVYRDPIFGPDGDEEPAERHCSAPGLQIPDNDPVGLTDTLIIDPCVVIDDLNLSVNTTHSWVGDLRYTLTHIDGANVVPLDRPGVPQSTAGCSGDNIEALLDDDALPTAEDACAETPPAVSGVLRPGDPPDEQLFEAFRGEDLCGTWELNVTDNAQFDTGTLDEWCLVSGPEPVTQRPVTDYMLDLVQRDAETAEIVGGVGYDIRVDAEGLVGAVPDGSGRPGTPLTVNKAGAGQLLLAWDDSCPGGGAIDTDYIVYEGSLAALGDHSPERCSTEGLRQTTLTPSPGDTYYLIVPRDLDAEGSHGLDSTGTERLPGQATCLPQVPGGC